MCLLIPAYNFTMLVTISSKKWHTRKWLYGHAFAAQRYYVLGVARHWQGQGKNWPLSKIMNYKETGRTSWKPEKNLSQRLARLSKSITLKKWRTLPELDLALLKSQHKDVKRKSGQYYLDLRSRWPLKRIRHISCYLYLPHFCYVIWHR